MNIGYSPGSVAFTLRLSQVHSAFVPGFFGFGTVHRARRTRLDAGLPRFDAHAVDVGTARFKFMDRRHKFNTISSRWQGKNGASGAVTFCL